ncbi:transporter substrate-binding domain-containing protein [Methylovirgula sp. 4M-Z18]|uniref:transporter substrate-binding domain-containing protein n=1 Tax=Methylovirgula sp. 4M-Z18 TaxID=2293567 RepID=UPI000E2F25C5|nr:transporter substrate-binding domain-containing protein [Methylovirgula sp. 4M-Z18]RFB80042.1 amino acid ABC transporter [Methylovirgula sp. 4M-Z18]
MTKTKLLLVAATAVWAGLGAASAKEWKTVRIGMDASYAPFESVDSNGQIVGFEVDYFKALCDKIKVTCTFQNQDWDGIIPSLDANKFDVIASSMNITEERKQKVNFSDFYYSTGNVIIGQASDKAADIKPETLKGKTIGTQTSTIQAKYIEKLYPGMDTKLYQTQDEPNLDLAAGRIDYVLGDAVVEQDFLDHKANGCCKIIGNVPKDSAIQGPGVAAAFRKEDTDLLAMFNKAIAEADADGTYKAIEAKYFKFSIRGK